MAGSVAVEPASGVSQVGGDVPCILPCGQGQHCARPEMFMPRSPGDRPQPVPPPTRNGAFISQFVELPMDVVFTVEYSVRAAQMAVYQLLDITQPIPPVTPHDTSVHARFEALLKAFK